MKNKTLLPTRAEKTPFWKSFLKLLPFILVLLVVPLLVRAQKVELDPLTAINWQGQPVQYDFFSYHKAMWVMGSAGLAGMLLFFKNGRFPSSHSKKALYALLGVFALLLTLSALFSKNPGMALHGAPDRYEGLYVWLSYIALVVYALSLDFSEREVRILVSALVGFTLLYTLVGFLQYRGYDFFNQPLIRRLVIGPYQATLGEALRIPASQDVYVTSYNNNYVASMAALAFPFFLSLALLGRQRVLRWVSALSCVCWLFLLFASSARSGIVGVAFSLFTMAALFWRALWSHKKQLLAAMVLLMGLGGAAAVKTQGALFQEIPRIAQELTAPRQPVDFREKSPVKVDLQDDHVTFSIYNASFTYDQKADTFFDANGVIPYEEKDGVKHFLPPIYEKFQVQYTTPKDQPDKRYMFLRAFGFIDLYFEISKGSSVRMVDYAGRPVSLEGAPSIGFQGREQMGSGRGYIWSRTLPLLKKSIFLGYGPDTFLNVFPQNDFYAKYYVYGGPWMVTDKPHNLYLQIAVNSGLLSLLIFLGLVGLVVVQSARRFSRQKVFQEGQAVAIGCVGGMLGFLGAGMFNDSVVSVSPIFWIFLGIAAAYALRPEGADVS